MTRSLKYLIISVIPNGDWRMSDLSDYHEKNNLIGRINHQEELINRLLNENKNLTNELSSANKKIKSRERSLRNAKSELKKLKPKVISRHDTARKMVIAKNNGENNLTLREISEKVFLSYESVKGISFALRKTNREVIK